MSVYRYGGAALVMILSMSGLPPASGVDVPACFGEPATIIGTEQNDELVGTEGDDVIHGVGGSDYIRGFGGNDRLCGGAGREDVVRGGQGDDRLDGGEQDDYLFGGPGADILTSSIAIASYDFTGDRMRGGEGNDTFEGTAHFEHFFPGPGDDSIEGGELEKEGFRDYDMVHFADADKRVWVDLRAGTARGQGSDSISNVEHVEGSSFNDILLGDEGYNYIFGNPGDDVFSGRGGNDYLNGYSPDLLNGYSPDDSEVIAGSDRIFGGNGNDALCVGGGKDEARGENGDDWFCAAGTGVNLLKGGPGRDGVSFFEAGPAYVDLREGVARALEGTYRLESIRDIRGSRKNDKLFGNEETNYILGNANNDTILGRGGNDRLNGQADVNSVNGGAGTDKCRNPSRYDGAVSCETP